MNAEVIDHPLVERPEPALAPIQLSEQTVLLQVIQRAASDPSVDLDRMERLLVMHERLTAKRAEQEFHAAMARFKRTAPKILKDKHVHFESKNGGAATDYYHATLGAVCEAIVAGLGEVGISHRWELDRKDARIFVTCVLTHEGGFSTRTVLDGPPDTSGNKNPLQQVSSTVTLLQRYTLLAATGMGTHDQDDDGGAGGGAPELESAPPPEGYEQWKADMLAVDTYAAFGRAWKGADEKFRAHVNAHDGTWFDAHKAALSAKLVKQ